MVFIWLTVKCPTQSTRGSLHIEILLVKLETMYSECFISDHLLLYDYYYHALCPLSPLTNETRMGVENREVTIPC